VESAVAMIPLPFADSKYSLIFTWFLPLLLLMRAPDFNDTDSKI
jgi:hypothetical protein